MTLPATPIINPVSPSSTTIYYCDPQDIVRRLSTEGTRLRLEDYGNGSIAGEAGSLDAAIWDATETINYYCYTHYDPGSLVNSLWVNRRCVDIAVYLLSLRKGNTVSGSIAERYKTAISQLEQVHAGLYEIPNCPYRHTLAPAFSNVRIDQRYNTYRLRVEATLSDSSPRPYNYQTDWTTLFDLSF